MAAAGRLHPRHWDGHRLLRFLTGLALLALAFGTPAASAAPASPAATAVTTVTTTVETAAVAPVSALRDDGVAAQARTTQHSVECQHDAGRAAGTVPPASAALAGIAPAAQRESRAPPR